MELGYGGQLLAQKELGWVRGKAIVAGETDPQVLAQLKHPRIKSSTTEIAKALTGDYRPEHLFVLKQELTLYQVYQHSYRHYRHRN